MKLLEQLTNIESVNFALTNRVPRRALTLFFGWLSRVENPLLVKLALFLWRSFTDGLNLNEAKQREFKSLHDCFIRELKPGLRPVDLRENVIISPCDAVIGAFGQLQNDMALQIKGAPYSIVDLLLDEELVESFSAGFFVTLRLKSTMYHRFHAPYDGHTKAVKYISGDVWNVNPIALKRVPQLFCKNERAVLPIITDIENTRLLLVPVAAILVASMRIHGLTAPLDLRYKGANPLALNRAFKKGDELGYFEHGSTIIVLSAGNLKFTSNVVEGNIIKMGEPLLELDSLN